MLGDTFLQTELNSIKDSYKDKSFLYLPAKDKKKFDHLMPWKEINRIIRQCRLSYPRLRLHKEGQLVAEDLYTEIIPQRRGNTYTKIIATKLYEQLQNGATLIIDAIDELHEDLDFFVSDIERTFKNKVQVNAYMSWGDNIKGFTTHWDDHDVLIFQIYGKKHWFVFDETRKYPLYKDLHEQHSPPTKHSWEKIIQAGDVLFIPRGQWHHAVAINEPSLHLTVGFECRTGINYIQWLQEKLYQYELFRKDIPTFASKIELTDYYNSLVESFRNVIKDNNIDDYLKDIDVTMENRPQFSLPWAGFDINSVPDNMKIMLNTLLISDYQNDGETIKFSSLNKQYEFSSLCDNFFRALMNYKPCKFVDLLKISDRKLTRSQHEEVISSLLKDGLLAIVE